MEIPKDMKGLEKSITSSRTRVIVSGATAMSAFCWRDRGRMSVWQCELFNDHQYNTILIQNNVINSYIVINWYFGLIDETCAESCYFNEYDSIHTNRLNGDMVRFWCCWAWWTLVVWYIIFCMSIKSYPIYQLSNHAIPDLGLCISCSVFTVTHNP